jgi:methionyl-tRNA synthetase
VEWGIPFPGDESQTIYVWIDALINYYSAQKVFGLEDIWPADVHLMAKDILWFHAIIWPAILIALDLTLPKKIFAHGFFTVGGEKMSKTRGNVLNPNKLVEKFGADAVRYALLREFPFGEDGDISEEKIAARYQSELSNGLGNLLQRTISMINKYDVKIQSSPQGQPTQENDKSNPNEKISKLIENLKFDQALQEISGKISKLNQYIEENKPWELAKTDTEKLSEVLRSVHSSLSGLIAPLYPFMPETSEKMQSQLEALQPEPLFPRI